MNYMSKIQKKHQKRIDRNNKSHEQYNNLEFEHKHVNALLKTKLCHVIAVVRRERHVSKQLD